VKPQADRRVDSAAVDLVVCLPVADFHAWYDEGGTPEFPDDFEYYWLVGRAPPSQLVPGQSGLYVVCAGALRGYAPIMRVDHREANRWALVRDGRSAEPVTIDESTPSFRGWRYRWWRRENEREFVEWAWEAVPSRD
jgi:hypothetical protein